MGYLGVLSILLTSTLCYTTAYQRDPDECNYRDKYCRNIYKIDNHNCDCQAESAGQLKFDQGKVLVCDGREWKSLQYEEKYGSRKNPGFSCEDIMANSANQAANGVYWIALNDTREAFPVYCDMAAGGWTMVFKAVSGVDRKVFDTYNSAHTSSEEVIAALDITDEHHDHYKNRIVLNWEDFGASEARVVVFKEGHPAMELKFNTAGSDKLNWFSLPRLVDSPWTDIDTEPKNAFSIQGLDGRNFFINKSYGGCNVDAGWLAVTSPDTHCNWETRFLPRKNVVIYSKLSGKTTWSDYNFQAMAFLKIALCLLTLNWLCDQTYGGSWKECTWKQENGKDEGVIWACEFEKCHSDTFLHVYYSGNIRIAGCDQCCNRWYFTFNDAECSSPGAIDATLYQAHAGDLNKHEHGHVEGYCNGVPKGNVKVEVRVGECVGTGQALGNAYTGFGSTSRIFIEEVSPPDQ
ncbi:Saccharopine dehydrogenase [Desmophyllum pertusum]|uniref:Saccharopine dehydrogenase n=1 Tax=Desmophyllum pertusum TaxID=174260 RepID=A0A9W9YD39_9CNID|nr:Saccharopine dehydrogenase [Desmophyllum pertusum]